MYKLATVFAVALVALGTPVNAQQFPAPKGFVTDEAQVLQPATVAQLEKELAQQNADGKPVVFVVTVQSLGGYSIEQYATSLFNRWGIGDPQKNDGVLLLIAPNDRKARIALGRGIDTFASRNLASSIMSTLVEEIKADRLEAGVVTATRDLTRQEWIPAPTREAQQRGMLTALAIIAVVLVVIIIGSWVYTRYENRRQSLAWLEEIWSALERMRPHLHAEGVKSERATSFQQHERTHGEWNKTCAKRTNWSAARAAIDTLRSDVQVLEWQVNNDLRLVADAKNKLPDLLARLPQAISDAEVRIDAAGDTTRAANARRKLQEARRLSDQAAATNQAEGLSTVELVALYVIVKNAHDSCSAVDAALVPPTTSYTSYVGGDATGGGGGGVSDGGGVTGAW